MRRSRRFRVPERPRGFYAAYLDELIERNRAKREEGGSDTTSFSDAEAKEEAYWRERERWHAEQQKFKDAA
jgi:hypothetical protein